MTILSFYFKRIYLVIKYFEDLNGQGLVSDED